MPDVPEYRNIPTPSFTRTQPVRADTQIQRAVQQAGGAIANIGTKILGEFKQKQEISQYATAQTDAIVAMNNLQAELLKNPKYQDHEELAIEAKENIRKDAMRDITEPEAQAAFDRWFGKAYEQLEQSVVVNAIGAGKRKFAADLQLDLEKSTLMELNQGEIQIEKLIADGFIAGVPAEILIGLKDDALHDLQLNDVRRITRAMALQDVDDFDSIENFLNRDETRDKYGRLDANDWANVERQVKSDFSFNRGLQKEAEMKARNKSFEIVVDEIMFKNTPNMTTLLYTDPRFNPLSGEDKLRLEGVMKEIAAGSGEGGEPNFVDTTWLVEFLKKNVEPGVEAQDLRDMWEQAVIDKKITGKDEIEHWWDEIPKMEPDVAAKDGLEIINNTFNRQIKELEGSKRKKKQEQLDRLREQKAEANVLYTDFLKENPRATPTEKINEANRIDEIFRKGRVPKSIAQFDDELNNIIDTGVAEVGQGGGRAEAAGIIPEPTNDNTNRVEFERLTGVKLSPISGNMRSGTDPSTEGNYESYKVGRKWWRWYQGKWQVYKKRKGWVNDSEGPK